ncbi:odorant receptor 9a-like [Prorops nasuta]|uniref:odorant receptor 9a-like n=1 Tax=Prorops nasuta TaxID=863751 RepID=UPI0034CE6C75
MFDNISSKYVRKGLLIMGLWPEQHKLEVDFPFLRYRYLVPLAFIIFLISIPQTVNLFIVYNNLVLITENLTIANLAALLTCMKFFIMKSNGKVLDEAIKSYVKDWTNLKDKKEKEILTKNANTSGRISIVTALLAQGTVSIKVFQRLFWVVLAEINGLERCFVFQSWFPSIMKVTPYYQLVCFGQIVGAYCLGICYAGVDCFVFMLVFHLCAQFQILRRALTRMVNSLKNQQNPERFGKVIGVIVRKHEHLNYLAKTMEDSFNSYLLLQVLVSTLLICFQGFLAFKEIFKSNSFPVNEMSFLVTYVIYVTSFVYFYCYMGELLTNSSAEMRNAVFESNWQQLSTSNIKMLMFIIFRTRRPLQMTAGKFNVLSMQTFSKIVKTAAGYLSVMVHAYKG